MKYTTTTTTIQTINSSKFNQRKRICEMIKNKKGTILELFAGKGVLTEKLYQYHSAKNIMVDRENYAELARFNDSRYKIIIKDNMNYINEDLTEIDDLTLVDFDAFGTPIPTIKKFFENYAVKKPFFLCLTDGIAIRIKKGYQNKEWLTNDFQKFGYVTEYKKINTFLLLQHWLILTLRKIAEEHNFRIEKINMMTNQLKGRGASTIYMGFNVRP